MNKFTIALFIVCSIAFVQGNIWNDLKETGVNAVRNAVIDTFLKDEYKDSPKKAGCMINYVRKYRIDDNVEVDIFINHAKLRQDLEPYISVASLSCSMVIFVRSPVGICILLLIAALIVISFISCLIRCINK